MKHICVSSRFDCYILSQYSLNINLAAERIMIISIILEKKQPTFSKWYVQMSVDAEVSFFLPVPSVPGEYNITILLVGIYSRGYGHSTISD